MPPAPNDALDALCFEEMRNVRIVVTCIKSHLPIKKPRVGVVGEILVKFHPTANNDIFGTIERGRG